ncbi:hypothetical protein ACQ4PT_070033 [Festuca glaucescens]
MGSLFSSPAPPANAGPTPEELAAAFDVVHQLLNREPAMSFHRKFDPMAICNLANLALNQYNCDHPGTAEFYCPDHLTKELELKAACVGFRKDLWYHLNFLARRRRGGDAVETRRFFAEIRFEPSSDRLIVETCVVLGTYTRAILFKHVAVLYLID